MAIDTSLQNIVTIAVMGATGAGKSTFINMLSNSGFAVGAGLLSCTSEVKASSVFTHAGRHIQLLDTPGFDDTITSDREILQRISSFLADQYRQNVKLSGIIYMHRISDFKMGGISRRNFGMFRSLCGEKTLKNVVIVTNMWGEVSESVGAARENELRTSGTLFKPVLDQGAQMMRHYNTLASAQAIVERFIPNNPEAIQIQVEVVEQHKDAAHTTAGAVLETEEMERARRAHEEEMRRQREAAEAARRAQEEQRAREVAAAQQAAEEARQRAVAEQMRIAAQQEEERRRQAQAAHEAAMRLAAEAEARRQEEERLRQLREEEARRAQEAEAERQRQLEHIRQLEQQRHRHRRNDCIIC